MPLHDSLQNRPTLQQNVALGISVTCSLTVIEIVSKIKNYFKNDRLSQAEITPQE